MLFPFDHVLFFDSRLSAHPPSVPTLPRRMIPTLGIRAAILVNDDSDPAEYVQDGIEEIPDGINELPHGCLHPLREP